MIEIGLDKTAIFQLAIVLILMAALSNIVFKPFLKVLQARKDWVEGAERRARELQQRTEELMEKYRDTMAAAQAEGTTLREEIRKEGLAKEMEILQMAMEDANRFLEEMRAKIQEESQVARASLRLHGQSLSRDLAEKMLGRSIQ
jgi:F-type H+-transporting ATPase subunit b